ncbi:hypothetical protein [Paracoccus yeei]|uniref:hypothetical protein n=1 Tax=Paracoccus yeei TaxID=147645 RepID=UPI003BF78969
MVETTKNPGEIYPAGVAPSKTDIILFEQEIRQAVTNVEIGKADIANSGKIFPSRESAIAAGQEALRPALSQIITREDDTLAVRSASATADDPLFDTYPQWGVVFRGASAAAQPLSTVVTLNVPSPGADNPNTLTATRPADVASIPEVDRSLYIIDPPYPNTGPVTINGKPLRDADNQPLTRGMLRANRRYIIRFLRT